MAQADYAPCYRLARELDYERYLCALLAPPRHQPALMALLAFYQEIAGLHGRVSEPVLGFIRLQWWRESIETACGSEAAAREHEVTVPLTETIRRYRLRPDVFEAMLKAREQDLEPDPPPDLTALESWLSDTSGGLLMLWNRVLTGQEDYDFLRHLGIGWGMVGVLRSWPHHTAQGKVWIPATFLKEAGVTADVLQRGEKMEEMAMRLEPLRKAAHFHLEEAARLRPANASRLWRAMERIAALHLRRITTHPISILQANVTPPGVYWHLLRGWLSRS